MLEQSHDNSKELHLSLLSNDALNGIVIGTAICLFSYYKFKNLSTFFF